MTFKTTKKMVKLKGLTKHIISWLMSWWCERLPIYWFGLPTSPTSELVSQKKKKKTCLWIMCPFLACSPYPQKGALGLTFNTIILVANPIIVLWWCHFPLLLGKECMCECELFWLLDFSFFNSRNHIKKKLWQWSIEVILYV